MTAAIDAERLLALPKVELHLHLEGAWNLDTLATLARRNGVTLPADTAEGLRRAFAFRSFEEFVGHYVACSRCLQQPEDFQLLVRDVMRAQARQNVLWTEAHFTIGTHLFHGGNGDEIGEAMWEAICEGEREYGVRLRLIPDIVRNVPWRWADKTIEWALDFRHRGVVALGLSGIERGYSAEPFRDHFAAAVAGGLHCTAHAGEFEGPKSVREVLTHCHAERIGHGVRAIEDPELVELLRDERVPLEICPTSNLCLGVYPDLAAHPFHRLYREGVRVTVNSDDPVFFDTDLTRELAALVAANGYGPDDLRNFLLEAVAAAFCSESERNDLAARVRAGLADVFG